MIFTFLNQSFGTAVDFSDNARWIYLAGQDHSDSAPVAHFRRVFDVDAQVKTATATVTAKGIYHFQLNGKSVSDAYFLPGWFDYESRIYCHSFDVTDHMRSGENAIGIQLGDGWYCGYLGFKGQRRSYGEHPELLFELVVEYENGSTLKVSSDESWKAATGPILESDFYNGEVYDARLEMPGWALPEFDDRNWADVATGIVGENEAALELAPHAPVVAANILKTIEFWQTDSGSWIFDLGQNMVGNAKICVPSVEGMEVTIRFAEMLKKDRTLYTENYRTAKSTDVYICKGGQGFEFWEPLFTFHGFRYVELNGLREDLQPSEDWVQGIVLHNEMKQIGRFECSNPDLNQLQSNIVWGQKGNFLEVPTDCPQRDERLGWTGDAQVFAPTACFNFDVLDFFKKWMVDVLDAQREDGAFPHVAPNVLGEGWFDSPAWADAGVIVPWEVYVRYGDREILEDNFEGMLRWISYQEKDSPGLVRADRGFGDWLQPYQAKERDRRGDTNRSLIGTAYFAYSTALTARIAGILGDKDKADELESLKERIVVAFQKEFWTAEDHLTSDTQTAYLLALAFDLLPEEKRPIALDHLLRLIDEADGHLRTGFVGTPLLTQVLTRFGKTDLAYSILLKETYPGWIFSIRQGATTMWERWNSYSHEDGFGDAKMNSFNHYAYGAIGQWMYETIAGLKPDPEQPGYQHFYVAPKIGGDLQWAKASVETQNGKAASKWRIEGDSLVLIATVPEGSKATVIIPEGFRKRIVYQGRDLDGLTEMKVAEGVHTFVASR